MRILYHHRTMADGAEGIHIRSMVNAFRDLGHEVHVEGIAGEADSSSRRLAQHVKNAMPAAAFEVASLAANVAEYVHVRRSIETLRPDFLYKRHGRFDVGALGAARKCGIPTVLEVNCLFAAPQYERFEPMAFSRLAARFERRALEMADIVLAVSTPLARQIVDVADAEPVVLPNGVDLQLFDPARARGERVRTRHHLGAALTIGWSGVIREWHRLELLVETAVAIPDVRLLIVGDGPGRAALEARATARGVRDRMVITGRVPHEAMPDHIAAMDIAAVASEGTGVASPMKLIEYMAMGRAIVAPRLDNITDVITDHIDGLLFSPDDGASLTEALRRLVCDAELRTRLGDAARAKVTGSRSWQHNAATVVALVRGEPDGRRAASESGRDDT